jgi:HEAT repeat protein
MPAVAGLWVVLLLQATDPASEACGRFKESYRTSTSATVRAKAVLELAKTVHERTFAALLPLLGSEEKEVRAAAIQGLAGFGTCRKSATPALLAALAANRKEPEVRVSIFDSLGKLADPASLETVHAHFRDPDSRVAASAIACAGAMRQKESLDPLLELQRDVQRWIKAKQSGPYRDERGQKGEPDAVAGRLHGIQAGILKAFQAITLEPWTTPAEWEFWWMRRRSTFEVPPKPPLEERES